MDFRRGIRNVRDDMRKETGFWRLYVLAEELPDEHAQREKWIIHFFTAGLSASYYVLLWFWLWPLIRDHIDVSVDTWASAVLFGMLVIVPFKGARGFIEVNINNAYQGVKIVDDGMTKTDEKGKRSFFQETVESIIFSFHVFLGALKTWKNGSRTLFFPEHIFQLGRKKWDKCVDDHSLSVEDIKDRALPYIDLEIEREEKSTWRGYLEKMMPSAIVGIAIALFGFFMNLVVADANINIQMSMLPEEELVQLVKDITGKETTKKDFISKLDVEKDMSKAFNSFLLVTAVIVIAGKLFDSTLYEFRRGSKIDSTILLREVVDSYLKEHSDRERDVQIFSHEGRVLSFVKKQESHRQN